MAAYTKIIVFILTAGIKTANTAPTAISDLWLNPCDNHPVRHVRSTAEEELNFFIRTLNKVMFKDLKDLYPKNLKKVRGNCPRLNKLIKPVQNAPNITIAHQSFYKSMIELAVFLDQLMNMTIKTNTNFDLDRRKFIYERTKDTLKLTICEFNDTIMNKFNISDMFFKGLPQVNTRCLPKQADLSRIQMLDMQFFKKLRKFFRQGKRLLKNFKRKSKSGIKAKKNKKRIQKF